MHPSTLLLAATSLTLAAAASITPRIPRLGVFGVSTTPGCPLVNQELSEFALGQQSDACRNFYNNITYAAVNVYYWVPQCLLTLYTTIDCSDDGIVSGPGCWSPEGGIKGYKVTCPYL